MFDMKILSQVVVLLIKKLLMKLRKKLKLRLRRRLSGAVIRLKCPEDNEEC